MLRAVEQQREENERSPIVQTAFFRHQAVRRDQQAQEELAWVTAHNQQLLLAQQSFQSEYQRLQKICQFLKSDTQATQDSIPVLDQKISRTVTAVKSLHLLTSAIDNFLQEVANHGQSHRTDTKTLTTLATDLRVTGDLLASPSAQTLAAFQKQLNNQSRYKKDTKIADAMLRVSVAIAVLAIPVALGALGAFAFLGLPAVAAITIIMSAKIACLGACLLASTANLMRHISTEKDHPITAQQRTIEAEASQYLPPAPSFG